MYIRHRRILPSTYRVIACSFIASTPDHRGRDDRGRSSLCPRRECVHCRCRGAMAARCVAFDNQGRRSGRACRGSRPRRRSDLRPRLHWAGAPHWVPEARGVLFGLTRGTTSGDIARATLDGIAFQVADLLESAAKDLGRPVAALRVDGGVAANEWFLKRQADLLGLPLLCASFGEATARGAALLAGIGAGIWSGEADLIGTETGLHRFEPTLPNEERERRLSAWRRAVRAVIAYAVKDEKG